MSSENKKKSIFDVRRKRRNKIGESSEVASELQNQENLNIQNETPTNDNVILEDQHSDDINPSIAPEVAEEIEEPKTLDESIKLDEVKDSNEDNVPLETKDDKKIDEQIDTVEAEDQGGNTKEEKVEAPKPSEKKKKTSKKRPVQKLSDEEAQALNDSFQKLREQIAERKRQERELNKANKGQKKEIVEEPVVPQSEVEDLQQQLNKLQEDYDKATNDLNEATEKIVFLQNADKTDELLTQVGLLEESITEKDELIKSLTEKIENDNSNNVIEELKDSINSLQEQLAESKKECEQLRNDLTEANEKITSLEESDQTPELLDRINVLESAMAEKDETINSLNEKIESDTTQSDLNEMKIRNDYLENRLSDKDQEIEQLKLINEELKENPNNPVIQESFFDVDKFNELEEQVDILKNENESLKQQLIEKDNTIKKLEETVKLGENPTTNNSEFDDLKKVLAEDRKEYIRLKEILDSQTQTHNDKIALLEQTIEDKVNEINDLNSALDAYKNTIVRKNEELYRLSNQVSSTRPDMDKYNQIILEKDDEINSLKEEIETLKERIENQTLESVETESQKDIYNANLEKRIEQLTKVVEELKHTEVRDPYYSQMEQLKNLRDEMNSRFAEAKQEKYVDEIRRLKEEFIILNEKLRNDGITKAQQETVSPKSYSNVNEDMREKEVTPTPEYDEEEYVGVPEENVVLEENEIPEETTLYSYEDITDPQFISKYNKLEKTKASCRFEIEEDNRRFNLALSKNNAARQHRYHLINQINKELDILISKYNQSNGDSIQNKELYEREQVKAAEKIRFHEEKIRDIAESITEATYNHQQYVFIKTKQINDIIEQQNELIAFYGEKLRLKGIEPKAASNREFVSPVEKKVVTSPKMTAEYEKPNTIETIEAQPIVDSNLQQLKHNFSIKKEAYQKFNLELKRCLTLENELRTTDEVVNEYCKYSLSMDSLRADLDTVRQEKSNISSQISEYLSDPSKRSEMLTLKVKRDDLEMREQDLLSKISYSNKKVKDLANDDQVKKYNELVEGIKKINSRMNDLKSELLEMKQQIGA